MTLRIPLSFALASLAGASFVLAQEAPIAEARVREVVGWLAADERGGRDTPSPGLEAAAQWLAERFAAAGLQQVQKGSWFHDYTLPGLRVDSTAIALQLQRKLDQEEKAFDLKPDTDVRLWRASEAVSGEAEACTVAPAGDPVLQQLLNAQSGRRPIVLEVAEDHPYWQQSQGARTLLGGRRASSRPVFVVRRGLLPEPPTDGREVAWSATWSAPAPEKADLPLKNVLALLPGTDKKDEYVVVSAHYDHVGTGNPVGGDGIYNGADDDATGTTAVVLLAEAMAKQKPPRRSVLFVCFSAEEKGLRGSAAFCERPPVPKEQIVVNLNLEMLGRPEAGKQKQAWITGADLSDFAGIAAAAFRRAEVGLVDFPMAGQLFSASDNYSFVRQGIVAHSVSAGSLHKDYHQPGDEVAKLDLPHMTAVIRGLLEFATDLANRDQPPQWNEKGQQRLQRLRR